MKIEMAVIIMSEKIFILCQDDLGNYEIRYDDKIFHFLWEVAPILNEQQATISQLREMNGQLREINKELGDDLYNCRLNKNIISEKLKLWQDTLAEYDIYTIKDLYESFELDAKISKEKDKKIKELEVKVLNLELEIKRLEKMIWKIQWRFQQEVGIEKAREHYREIDKEMKGVIEDE